ncbi:hypothetical protein EAG_01808, partial [Camponotus floridanus]
TTFIHTQLYQRIHSVYKPHLYQRIQPTAFIHAHLDDHIYTYVHARDTLLFSHTLAVIHSHRDTITYTRSRLYTHIEIQFLAHAHVYTLAPRYTQLYT